MIEKDTVNDIATTKTDIDNVIQWVRLLNCGCR